MPCNCNDCRNDRARAGNCETCGAPENRCECVLCYGCAESVAPTGSYSLSGHTYCLICYEDTTHRNDRDPAPWGEAQGTFRGEPSTRFPRYVGIEIECGVPDDKWGDLAKVMERWGCGLHDDGSVSVDGQSYEIVTSPARGVDFEAQIEELGKALGAAGAKVNRSCGLHVHVDVRELTTAQVLGVVRLYSRIEKTLYSLVARSRRTNSFSGPWGEDLVKGDVLNTEIGVTEREKALDINAYGNEHAAQRAKQFREKHSSRYRGLNINAIHVHGTLEFRLHHGTVNGTKIKNWAAVCSAIVEYAATHSEEEIQNLRGTPAELLERVLGTDRTLIGWTRARRRFFEDKERERRGLAPRRATRAARAAPVPMPAPDVIESGELPGDSGRVGRRAFR